MEDFRLYSTYLDQWRRACQSKDYGERQQAADKLIHEILRHAHSPSIPREEWA